MTTLKRARRRFLKESAVLAGVAVGGLKLLGGQKLRAETTGSASKDAGGYGQRSRCFPV